jgi:nucleoid-associated protein YgaU
MKTRLIISVLVVLLLAPLVAAQTTAGDPHLAKAVELRAQAISAYGEGDYDRSAELARQAKAELALIQQAAKAPAPAAPQVAETEAQPPLPASYTVRLIPEDRDCLSKIAGYPFIYGDKNKWTVLYRANKKTLKHPENADIVLPGEVLAIPSIAGEERQGDFDPEASYPSLSH